MIRATPAELAELSAYCAELGRDHRLVQGAGGNVSIKTADVLHVKASGKWLADGLTQEVFTAVALAPLHEAVARGNYEPTLTPLDADALRPSIETLFHALLPERYVVHLHEVRCISLLVRADAAHWAEKLSQASGLRCQLVPYRKPGAPLAAAVHAAHRDANGVAEVLLLQNHGIIVSGATLTQARQRLDQLVLAAEQLAPATGNPPQPPKHPLPDGWRWADPTAVHPLVHVLGAYPQQWSRLPSTWAIYPDHVVFLGPEAVTVISPNALESIDPASTTMAIVQGLGVAVAARFGRAHAAQLCCYVEVLTRLPYTAEVHSLSHHDVGELLNWEAEHYRQGLSKR